MNTIVDIRSFTTARGVPTIVFVDMQREYLAAPRLIAIPDIQDALDNCRKLLEHGRAYGLPSAWSMIGSAISVTLARSRNSTGAGMRRM